MSRITIQRNNKNSPVTRTSLREIMGIEALREDTWKTQLVENPYSYLKNKEPYSISTLQKNL